MIRTFCFVLSSSDCNGSLLAVLYGEIEEIKMLTPICLRLPSLTATDRRLPHKEIRDALYVLYLLFCLSCLLLPASSCRYLLTFIHFQQLLCLLTLCASCVYLSLYVNGRYVGLCLFYLSLQLSTYPSSLIPNVLTTLNWAPWPQIHPSNKHPGEQERF